MTKLHSKLPCNSSLALNKCLLCLFTALTLFAATVRAAVLPEDRTDVLYHRYEGGGMMVDGPSVLVRKQVKDTFSFWGNYYVDMISSASIDVMTQGSPYTEQRVETSVGVDYLHDRTTYSLSHTNSNEEDYSADTTSFSLAQEFFGDMTTLSANYSKGEDEVRKNLRKDGAIVDTFHVGYASHQRFGVGLTQVLTRKWLVSLGVESVIDEGFLNNPYRSVRFLQPNGDVGTQSEIYPTTRNSDAVALRTMYYLPWHASTRLEYRYFTDSWGIRSTNYEIRYIHPIGNQWRVQAKYRAYSQNAATFYSDLYPYENAQNFLARDKELSEYTNSGYGLGVTYEIKTHYLAWFDKTTLNLFWDSITFNYKTFRENTEENIVQFGAGNEPPYSFNTNVVRFFLTFDY